MRVGLRSNWRNAMAFIPVPNVAKVAIEQRLDGEPVVNTLHFYNANGWSNASLTTLGTAIQGWWVNGLSPNLSTSLVLEQIVATDLSAQISPQATVEAGALLIGDVPGDCAPNNAALCVSLRSSFRGRSARGRNYVAGIPDSVRTRSRLTDTFLTAIVDAYEQLLTVGPQTSSTWVIVSLRSNKAPRAQGVFLPVTNIVVVDNVLDSMQRRLPGRGA